MASTFDNLSAKAIDALTRVMGSAATFTFAATAASETVSVIFNEFVGAVDARRRAIYTIAATGISAAPSRGDYFVLDGETDRWVVVDVRDSKAGDYELRCDGTLERL